MPTARKKLPQKKEKEWRGPNYFTRGNAQTLREWIEHHWHSKGYLGIRTWLEPRWIEGVTIGGKPAPGSWYVRSNIGPTGFPPREPCGPCEQEINATAPLHEAGP